MTYAKLLEIELFDHLTDCYLNELLVKYSNTWNHLTVQKNKLKLISKCFLQNVFINHKYLIYIYKEDLALNNLKWFMCHKTKLNRTKYLFTNLLHPKVILYNSKIFLQRLVA